MSPAPETSILMVPRGPRLVFITSIKPAAAFMFINKAAFAPMVSAFALSRLIPDIAPGPGREMRMSHERPGRAPSVS